MSTATFAVPLTQSAELHIPGLDAAWLRIGPTAGQHQFTVTASDAPFSITAHVHAALGLDPKILRPLKPGTTEVDNTVTTVDIELGELDLVFNQDGDFDVGGGIAISLPRCMLGTSGLIVQAGTIRWLSPASKNPPANTPNGFTGLFLDQVAAEIIGLPIQTGVVSMTDAFIGTSGFSGKVSWSDANLSWDGEQFCGIASGELAGFQFGLSQISIRLEQTSLVECDILGDVFVPYLDRRLGLSIGLDGNGGFTAAAAVPKSHPKEDGVTEGKPGTSHLLHVDIGGFLLFDLDSLRFTYPTGRKPILELTGQLELTIDGLDAPPFDFKGFRIDGDGNVAIEGGWLDLSKANIAPFHGFPIEITKIGFGTKSNGCRWLGLNGGLKLADGLPVGVSVEGLRICWDPRATDILDSLSVSLDGVGVQLRIEGTLALDGSVSFFSDPDAGTHGFRGHVTLALETLKLSIDARIVVGRTDNNDTFFYLFLATDLPAGIPLFSTGMSIYGFAGLIAVNMRPDKAADEDWYYGWYLRSPTGVSDEHKWAVAPGAFAGGVGTTIGTATDDGFSFSAKVLLVLLLPGPTLLLNGKGSFVRRRPGSSDVTSQGVFEALVVLDVPAKLFQADLAAKYSIPALYDVTGVAEAKFSWAPTPPADVWHLYVGQKMPMSQRVTATVAKILHADSYFQLNKSQIELGAHVGMSNSYSFGRAKAWFNASLEGKSVVSWNPQDFDGSLTMTGDAGISAYGVKIRSTLNSGVTVKAPDPWYVHMHIHLGIEIDMWLFSWSFSVNLPLTWGDQDSPLPIPATPVVQLLSAEHLKADESFPLSTRVDPIPADALPVIVFQRPVKDRASIGNPNTPNPPAEQVGPRSFSYQLLHIALTRKTGGDRMVAAAGMVSISGSSATLYGELPAQPALPGVIGSTIELPDIGASASVSGFANGVLSLDKELEGGLHPYRLRASVPQKTVHIHESWPGAYSTASVTLDSSPGTANLYAGGTLVQGASSWTVLGHDGTTVVVQAPNEQPEVGDGTLAGATGPIIDGQWLPVDDREDATDPSPTTKLMLWATSPFAWFRRNDDETYRGFLRNNPEWVCGPKPDLIPICYKFGDLIPGVLTGDFVTEDLHGSAGDGIEVKADGPDDVRRQLAFGLASLTAQVSGQVSFLFEPPIERLVVRYDANIGNIGAALSSDGKSGDGNPRASITAYLNDAQVTYSSLAPNKNDITLSGQFDRVQLTAGYLLVSQICVFPGWSCTTFDSASFPQQATGRLFYSELLLETSGTMSVDGTDLVVTPLRSSVQNFNSVLQILRQGYAFQDLVSHVPHVPGTPDPPPYGYDRFAGGWSRRTSLPFLRLPGLQGTQDTFVPGLGHVRLGPKPRERALTLRALRSVEQPMRSGGPNLSTTAARASIPPPEFGRWGALDWLQQMQRPTQFLGGIPHLVAQVSFTLPAPTVRVKVHLSSSAEVVAFAGDKEVARASASAGVTELEPVDDYIDRILVSNINEVRIKELCFDRTPTGAAWADRDGYQDSIDRSIESLYREDALLAPGRYSLEVTTGIDIGGSSPDERWFSDIATFSVGDPPGVTKPSGDDSKNKTYPYGGPLNDLGTYVHFTVPGAGERPIYRALDVGVAFNEPYVSRMFLAAGKPLSVAVVDSNEHDRRANSRNYWGDAPDLELSHEERQLINTYNTSPAQCVTVDVEQIPHVEQVSAGAGELLGPAELHACELRAQGVDHPVYRFEFVTSQFGGFVHHLATNDRVGRTVRATGRHPSNLQSLIAQLDSAQQTLASLLPDHAAKKGKATSGRPTMAEFADFDAAKLSVIDARAAVRKARSDGFAAIWQAYYQAPPTAVLPTNVEILRIVSSSGSSDAILGIDSPEPIHWDRTQLLQLAPSNEVPLRLRTITFDARDFGAPDFGTFEYADLSWTTNEELRVRDGALEPRVEPIAGAFWSLEIALVRATAVTFVVSVDEGGELGLSGTGTNVSPDVVQCRTTPGSVAEMTLTGDDISRVKLTLDPGMARVHSIRITEWHRALPAVGPLRIVLASLPTAGDPNSHHIDVTAYKDTALAGWTIRWFDAISPAAPALYHVFSQTATLKDGTTTRVFGANATPAAVAGMEVYGGGLVGTIPSTGAVFQLVDATGRVVHEVATMADASFAQSIDVLAFVKDDESRALLVPRTGTIDAGHWRLRLQMLRDAGAELPLLSVGGVSTPESLDLAFTTV